MAQNEQINIDLIINASQSAKTIKEQKQSLKEVRDALDNVKQGSGAFELLNDEARRLTASMDTLTLSFEDVYGEGVQPLTTQLGELEDRMYALAIAGQKDSEEFRTLQAEAIKMRKTIIDVDETVDAFAQKGAKLRGFIGIAQGITGAFGVAKGTLSLFGVENENLEQSLQQTAIVIEVLSGLEAVNTAIKEKNVIVSGIQNGIKKAAVLLTSELAVAEAAQAVAAGTATSAQIALNSAMNANPIGLLITGIVALTAAFTIFGNSSDKATESQKKLAESIKETKKEANFEIAVFKSQIEALKDLKTGSLERAALIDKINSKYGTTLKNLNDETAFLKQIRIAQDDYVKGSLRRLNSKINESKAEEFLSQAQDLRFSKEEKIAEKRQLLREGYTKNDPLILAINKDIQSFEKLALGYEAKAKKQLDINAKLLSEETAQEKAEREKREDADKKAIADELKRQKDANKSKLDNEKKTQKEITEDLKKEQLAREQAQKEYNDTIADLTKQASDLYKQYRLIGEDETITSFEKLKIQYELDNTNYLENEKDKIEKQKVYLKDGVINQDEYTKRVSEIEDLSLNIRNSRFKIFYFNQLALESNYKDEVIKSYLEINKSDLDNKLQQINAQEKLEKTRLKIKFDADKKEVANTVLTAQEKINELTKAEETKKKLITTYQNEIAKSEIVLKNARDIKTRQDAASDIEIYKGKIEQGKLEIEANKQLINEKKLLIDVNNKLYGNAAQMTAQDYFINNLVVEQDAFAQRINLLTTYYANQKDLIEDNRKIEVLNTTSSINDLTDSLKEKQELQKDLNAEILILQNDLIKAITDAEKKSINDKLELKARELDDNENFINQIVTAQQVANVKKLKEEQKYESDLLALKAGTIDSLEGFDLTELANLKEKHLKEIAELEKQKAKIVNFEKSINDLKIKQAKETAVVIETITGDSSKKIKAFTKDELENTADFVVALVNEISSLFNQINQNFVDGSVTKIEFEKEQALKAYDERIKAYEDMSSSMSNADRLKADKDNQIRLERERLEAEYDEKRKQAEYEGAMRSWKMSIAQAVVDSAAFVLKAGAQSGFFGAPAAIILGALQVGTILSNPPQKLATGGYVSGEGGPTDDKIPAMLSNGEFVINAAATSKNLPLLEMINNGTSPMTPSIPKFATGGYVNVVNNNNVDNSEIIRIFQEYMSQPIKAYVVSNDVTQQQNKDNRLKSRTSF